MSLIKQFLILLKKYIESKIKKLIINVYITVTNK